MPEQAYRIAESEDAYDDYAGKTLIGPDGWECTLGEPEDCMWYRDGSIAMNRLNEQHEEIQELRQLLEDHGINPDAG